ncbi:acetate kinase [Bradyrhizobium sp. USDA 4369]
MTMRHILPLNAGSSSIKFALFEDAAGPVEILRGQVEALGTATPHFEARSSSRIFADERLDPESATDHEAAIAVVIDVLQRAAGRATVDAVGHRIVHGGLGFTQRVVIADDDVTRIEALNPLAPLHQPHNLSGVRAAHRAFPGALQVA